MRSTRPGMCRHKKVSCIPVAIDGRPEFSARARGIASRASANERMAYCSREATCAERGGVKKTLVDKEHKDRHGDPTVSAFFETARLHAISGAPPP